MRELKFRYWDFEKLEMVYDSEWAETWRELKEAEKSGTIKIMQYIGFKDSHGKELYEGDMVDSGGISIGVIKPTFKYERSHTMNVREITLSTRWFFDYGSKSDIRLLGNIYENDELFKWKDDNSYDEDGELSFISKD